VPAHAALRALLGACEGRVSQLSLTNVTTHNVADAKAHLSQLLDAAVNGEDVIVARAGKPLVRLVPVNAPAARVLGFLALPSPDERFDPIDESELAAWS
jgi:prevent-host-death family protein